MNKLIEQIHQADDAYIRRTGAGNYTKNKAAQHRVDDAKIKRAAEHAQLKTARAVRRIAHTNQM